MQTTYYTITAREIVVSGDGVKQAVGAGRRLVCTRRPASVERPVRSGNVIDLAAWKTAREAPGVEEWEDTGLEEVQGTPVPAPPRPRKDHRRRILFGGELLATLSVVGVMILLMVRILGW